MLPVSGQPNGQGGPASPTSGTTGGVGGPAASPPGGTPKNQRRQRPPQTFAGMQQQGMARPSPAVVQQQTIANQQAQQAAQMQAQAQPAAQPASQQMAQPMAQPAQGGNMIGQLGGALQQQVMQMLADPTQGLNEAAMSNFDRQQRLIGQNFADTRERLNENLAARGLDASTIAASGLSRLEERQGQALTDSSTQIQEQLLRDRNAALNNAIQSAMGLRGQEITLDQNMWDRSNADRTFDLNAELGRGNLDINRQNLGLQRDRFGFEQARDERNFNYGRERDAIGDEQFDRRFDFDVSRDARNFGYQQQRDTIGDRQWQDQFDRAGNWRTEDNQYRDRRDAVSDDRFNRTWDRDQTWRNEDTTYRNNRDTIGDDRWNRTFNAANDQQRTGNILSVLQGMGFNALGPDVLNNILRSLGIDPKVQDQPPRNDPPAGNNNQQGSGYQNSGGELGTGQYPGQSRTMGGVTYTWTGTGWRRND